MIYQFISKPILVRQFPFILHNMLSVLYCIFFIVGGSKVAPKLQSLGWDVRAYLPLALALAALSLQDPKLNLAGEKAKEKTGPPFFALSTRRLMKEAAWRGELTGQIH